MTANAFVTLVTNADFARGARALLRSLARTGTAAARVAMHTAAVPDASLRQLEDAGATLVPVDLLPTSDAFNARHARDAIHRDHPFTKGVKPPFHTPLDNFLKLRLWQLPFERAVFLDADALVLRPIDKLFGYPELCAAPNLYESLADFGRMNSGVFTARPSEATFARLLAELDAPGALWPRTDQTFLGAAFPDWHGLPHTYNTLQYVWLNLPALWDWGAVRVLHYQYEKPWEDHAKAASLRPLIDLWRAYDEGREPPDLAALPSPGPP